MYNVTVFESAAELIAATRVDRADGDTFPHLPDTVRIVVKHMDLPIELDGDGSEDYWVSLVSGRDLMKYLLGKHNLGVEFWEK